jgi:hypothetical protein
LKEGTTKPSRHRRLIIGVSMLALLLFSLLVLTMLRGTQYLTFVLLAWLTGLSSGFLIIALRPTKSLEFYYQNYWGARTRIVGYCLFAVMLVTILEMYTLSQLLPELELSVVLLAIVIAGTVGATVYHLGKRSI